VVLIGLAAVVDNQRYECGGNKCTNVLLNISAVVRCVPENGANGDRVTLNKWDGHIRTVPLNSATVAFLMTASGYQGVAGKDDSSFFKRFSTLHSS
jgi:hypothetical protein